MNEEYFKEYKKRALMSLSKQPKMSLEEMKEQIRRVLNWKPQDGKPSPKKNSKESEKENPET
jgi:hypothetical protein